MSSIEGSGCERIIQEEAKKNLEKIKNQLLQYHFSLTKISISISRQKKTETILLTSIIP